MYASNLADDARIAYEYGLTTTPMSNDFSFVDQRIPSIQYFPISNPFMNRSYSMPQQQNQYNRSAVNSQQGLADNIQAVRHLWERGNASVIDLNMYNPMQQSTQNFPY
jgi:hypothetical protein